MKEEKLYDATDLNISFEQGRLRGEKDIINHIREQVKTWMPEKDCEDYTEGKRFAFRSVLILLQEMEDEK